MDCRSRYNMLTALRILAEKHIGFLVVMEYAAMSAFFPSVIARAVTKGSPGPLWVMSRNTVIEQKGSASPEKADMGHFSEPPRGR